MTGEGGGVKFRHFCVTSFVDDPRADDVLEFSRVPYSDPKQKRASARDGN